MQVRARVHTVVGSMPRETARSGVSDPDVSWDVSSAAPSAAIAQETALAAHQVTATQRAPFQL